jgi:hypothetical protein
MRAVPAGFPAESPRQELSPIAFEGAGGEDGTPPQPQHVRGLQELFLPLFQLRYEGRSPFWKAAFLLPDTLGGVVFSASALLPRCSRLDEDPSDLEPMRHQGEAGAPSGREPRYTGVHPTDDSHPPRQSHVFPLHDVQRLAVGEQLSRLPEQMPCQCRGLRWRRPSARTSSYGPAPFRINQMRDSRHHCMGCHHTGK